MLYIVATPIGNLKDITQRAVETLKNSDIILCEDTRISRKLLWQYQIKKPLVSYHHHSSKKKIEKIISWLEEGKNISLICDAGTPGIADPAGRLIEEIRRKVPSAEISPIPGPSALTAALSVSGLFANQFFFFGFLPKKKKRKETLEEIIKTGKTVVFFESPFRIIKTLEELAKIEKKEKTACQIVVLKELTKKFEKIWRANSIGEMTKKIKKGKEKIKGEFVVVLKRKNGK